MMTPYSVYWMAVVAVFVTIFEVVNVALALQHLVGIGFLVNYETGDSTAAESKRKRHSYPCPCSCPLE